MRVLFLYCERFELETFRKASEGVPDDERREEAEAAVVCLVHSEDGDDGKTATKLVKNARWIAGKFGSKRIVLHFFAHLGEDRGNADLARELLSGCRDRLEAAGYEARVMPFGYFCRLRFDVHGESLAKVFKVL